MTFDQQVLVLIKDARQAHELNDSLYLAIDNANRYVLSAENALSECSVALDSEKAANAIEIEMLQNKVLTERKKKRRVLAVGAVASLLAILALIGV